jgi:hypothetical protein
MSPPRRAAAVAASTSGGTPVPTSRGCGPQLFSQAGLEPAAGFGASAGFPAP